jgi:predicted LPLAT superfamily acyltransferase
MVRAAQSLQSLAKGTFTQRDIAELMLVINEGGRAENVFGGFIGHDEVTRALRSAHDEALRTLDPVLIDEAAQLKSRAMDAGY